VFVPMLMALWDESQRVSDRVLARSAPYSIGL
jgi:hypothetical protein